MNHVVAAIGLVAAGVGITVSFPQVWRLWRSTHALGISYASAVLGLLATSTWLTYGFLIVDPAQMLANVPGIVGAVLIAVLVVRRGRLSPAPALVAAAAWATLVVAGDNAVGAGRVGTLATTVTLVARVPQVWTAFRAPSLAALAPATFVLTVASASLWLTYGVCTHDAPVWTSSTGAMLLSLVILARYRVVESRRVCAEDAGARAGHADRQAADHPVPAVAG